MESIQKTGRVIGLLLLLLMACGIPSVMLRGLSTSMAASPTFLNEVFESSMEMRLSIFLDITASVLWLVIAIIAFPVIKKYKLSFALWFFGIWVVQFAVIVFSDIGHLSLLSLSSDFVNNSSLETSHYATLGLLKIEEYFWAHFMGIMLFALAAFSFYFFLFQTKLVPRLLSGWGMLAITLVFIACWLNIFDRPVSFYFFSQNGIHLIVLMGWLIAKGFDKNSPLQLK